MPTQPIFATDEDLAIRAPSDFALIVPADQVLARGEDATLSPDDPWILQTSCSDLDQRGIRRGCIVLLQYRPGEGSGPDESFAVEGVQDNRIRLRRKGQTSDSGEPPRRIAPEHRLGFSIPTLQPQVESASSEFIAQLELARIDLGSATLGETFNTVARRATILNVLYRQYLSLSRRTDDKSDAYGAKAVALKTELDRLLEETLTRWGGGVGANVSTAVSRATRLTR